VLTSRYSVIGQVLPHRIKMPNRINKHSIDEHVPSETDLCHEFGVSRMTAPRAETHLLPEGSVYRQPGSGTFVATPVEFDESRYLSGTSALGVIFDVEWSG
jgi:DNA-binding GntR family transcriptional regulator